MHGPSAAGTLQAGGRLADDGSRILAARIVGREHDKVAQFASYAPHGGPLGGVPVASAAKQRQDPARRIRALRERTGRFDQAAQGMRSVGIVHHRQERLAAIDGLEAPGHGRRRGDARADRGGVKTVALGRADRGEDVFDVEIADQSRPGPDPSGGRLDVEAHAAGIGLDIRGPHSRSAAAAVGKQAKTAQLEQFPALLVVGVDHGIERRPRTGALEQAPLGRGVGLHVAVEVQMLRGKIREDRRVELDAVDAFQGEGVRRGFHGCVAAADPAQLRQRANNVQ